MSSPRPLPAAAEAKLDEYAALAREAHEAGDLDTAEKNFLKAWESIPEPRTEYEYADSMATGLAQFFRDTGQAEKAKPWVELAREIYGDEDPDIDFLAATVHYCAGEFDDAYALFDNLYQQFRRRPFQGEDPAYLDFYLERSALLKAGKTPVNPALPTPLGGTGKPAPSDDDDEVEEELPDDIYQQVEALSEEGNELSDEGDDEGAEAVWRQALDLLPEPKTKWSAYTWLTTSIGEASYFQSNYADAAQMLFDALNGPDAHENPFVHYMLGKALWQIGEDEDRAIDELLRAYMLDGVDIFDGDEEEGPDMLQLLIDRGLVEADEG